jgi:hypothetical protein
MMQAIAIYRERFRPSAQLATPYLMLGLTVVAAESDGEAGFLFSSLQQSTLNNRTGRPSQVPPPITDFEARLDPYARAVLADAFACAIVGGANTIRQGLEHMIQRTGADEVMVTANIFDHHKRKRSFENCSRSSPRQGNKPNPTSHLNRVGTCFYGARCFRSPKLIARRNQCRPQALRLGRSPRSHHRRRSARDPSRCTSCPLNYLGNRAPREHAALIPGSANPPLEA